MTTNENYRAPLCDEDITDDVGLADRLTDMQARRDAQKAKCIPHRTIRPIMRSTLAAARRVA